MSKVRQKNNKRKWLKLALFALLLIFMFFLPSFFMKNSPVNNSSGLREAEIETYFVPVSHYTDEKDNVSIEEIKEAFKNPRGNVYIYESEKKDIENLLGLKEFDAVKTVPENRIIEEVAKSPNSFAIVPYQLVNPSVKTLSVNQQYLWDKPATYGLKIKSKTGKKDLQFDQSKVTLVTNVGDVILGRHVAKKMRDYNDYNHPWLKMAGLLKKGDLTFADLECPLSDSVTPPDEGMSFIVPTKAISGFKLAGIDIVGLANNHSANFGGLPDTLDVLKQAGIKYVGGGKNAAEAYSPVILEKNGLRFAFVDFNSIIGAINATENNPGVAKFDIKPWADIDNENDIAKIKSIIKEAKDYSDIVIAQFHWGVEYEPDPIQSQIHVAHEAIKSGADIIIGTHPHTVQGMEFYQQKPILYSLGNFIFDQEWSIETKQGTLAQAYFYRNKPVAVKLIPYQIEDYNQPNFATDAQKKQILDRIFKASVSKEYQN
jgi:poly-gamma-glutamate capsule biosynthesis protein CapA/YwtB (metallophosphatase superfamily)